MAVKRYSIKKKSVNKWKKMLSTVHAMLAQQMRVNAKLSPSKGKGGGSGVGR